MPVNPRGRSPIGDPIATPTTPGIMSAAQASQLAALQDIADPLYNMPSAGTIDVTSGFCDFLAPSMGVAPFAIIASGTGAAGNWATASGGRIGVVSMDTGTTTAGYLSVGSMSAGLVLGNGRFRWRADINISTAADVTNTFAVRVGLHDAPTGGTPADGCFFRYAYTENSGNWTCVTRTGGAETTTSSGVAAVHATAFRVLEIEVNAAASSVAFYVNGALVATHSTNIPSGAGKETGVCAIIEKSAGTTSRSALIDLMAYRYERTVAI